VGKSSGGSTSSTFGDTLLLQCCKLQKLNPPSLQHISAFDLIFVHHCSPADHKEQPKGYYCFINFSTSEEENIVLTMINKMQSSFFLWAAIPLLLLWSPKCATAFSSSSYQHTAPLPTIPLGSNSYSQLAVLDGAEWISVQTLLEGENKLLGQSPTKYGYMTIVTGRLKDDQPQQRVVGMQATTELQSSGDSLKIYQDSLAYIPDKISDQDAIATYITSLSAIHCALPRIHQVGGASLLNETTGFVGGKAVVLGGSELACFAANGLAALGAQVSLVSTGSPKLAIRQGM
jgi:hypothetical protein